MKVEELQSHFCRLSYQIRSVIASSFSMKLASFRVPGHADAKPRFGLCRNGRIRDLSWLAPSLLDFIETNPAIPPGAGEMFNEAEVQWLAPVLRPGKICCLALNNSANADRIMQGPKHPAMFIKPSSSLLGHNGAIECKSQYGRVHPEPELAVVIGK